MRRQEERERKRDRETGGETNRRTEGWTDGSGDSQEKMNSTQRAAGYLRRVPSPSLIGEYRVNTDIQITFSPPPTAHYHQSQGA